LVVLDGSPYIRLSSFSGIKWVQLGHWNRLEQRIWELFPQDIVEQEKQKLQKAIERYLLQVDIHIKNGGSINTDHDWVFKFVVHQSLKKN
jgi:hypothetical protein